MTGDVFHARRVAEDNLAEDAYLHSLRVVQGVSGETERIVAWLHDVVEDSTVTLATLEREGFAPRVIDAVDALSRRGGEPYFDYIARLKGNALAVRVKRADLSDNLNRCSPSLRRRYLRARKELAATPLPRPEPTPDTPAAP